MTEQDYCQELLDAEIVRVDLIPMDGTTMPVPFGVPNLSRLKGSYPNADPVPSGAFQFAPAVLTVAQSWGDDVDAAMKPGAKYKPTPARDAAGILRTHTLEVPIEAGFQALRNKENKLHNSGDLLLVMTAYNDQQYMAYTLPNTTQVALDDQVSTNGTMTLRVTVQSYSGVILLE